MKRISFFIVAAGFVVISAMEVERAKAHRLKVEIRLQEEIAKAK